MQPNNSNNSKCQGGRLWLAAAAAAAGGVDLGWRAPRVWDIGGEEQHGGGAVLFICIRQGYASISTRSALNRACYNALAPPACGCPNLLHV